MKERFGLYVIATDPVAGYEAVAQAAVKCSVRYLQLRMKDASHEKYVQTAELLRGITRGSATRLIVNDDLNVAIAADADGVHLGQDDMSVDEARRRWDIPGKIFGLSTHSMEQADKAAELCPDYIGIGPVYPTTTKHNTAALLGPEETGRIARRTRVTSVPIGGIDTQNLPALLRAGAENFCVANAVNSHPNPLIAMLDLKKIWETKRI